MEANQPPRSPQKDPSEWTTGEEPMTGPQASYLETLCREAGRDLDPSLTKAQASKLIDELQQQTGRGGGRGGPVPGDPGAGQAAGGAAGSSSA